MEDTTKSNAGRKQTKPRCPRCEKTYDGKLITGIATIIPGVRVTKTVSESYKAIVCPKCAKELARLLDGFWSAKPEDIRRKSGPVGLDINEALERYNNGETIEQIAKAMGVLPNIISTRIYRWRLENDPNFITDIGKVHALKRAGWNNKQIQDEFGCSMEAVEVALSKEEPREDYTNGDT